MKINNIQAVKKYVVVFFYLEVISGTFNTISSFNSKNVSLQNTRKTKIDGKINDQENEGSENNVNKRQRCSKPQKGTKTNDKGKMKRAKLQDIRNTRRSNMTFQNPSTFSQSNSCLTDTSDSAKDNISNNTQNNEPFDIFDKETVNDAMTWIDKLFFEDDDKIIKTIDEQSTFGLNILDEDYGEIIEIIDRESIQQPNTNANSSKQRDSLATKDISRNFDTKRNYRKVNQDSNACCFFSRDFESDLNGIFNNTDFAIEYLNLLNTPYRSRRHSEWNFSEQQALKFGVSEKFRKLFNGYLKSWDFVVRDEKELAENPYLISLYCFIKEGRSGSNNIVTYLQKMCYLKLLDSYLKKTIVSLDGIQFLKEDNNLTDIDILAIGFLGVTHLICKNLFIEFVSCYRNEKDQTKAWQYSIFLKLFFQIKEFILFVPKDSYQLKSEKILQCNKTQTEIQTSGIILENIKNYYYFNSNYNQVCIDRYIYIVDSFIVKLNLETHIKRLNEVGKETFREELDIQNNENLKKINEKLDEIFEKIVGLEDQNLPFENNI